MPTLNWIGKEKVINHHQDVPYKTLEPQYTFTNGKESKAATSENKIIHGDNLEALKSLLPEYEGKIKCIYIDPPYNTGNEGWVYNDNVSDPKLKKWLGKVVGKESEDLSRHDKWLCMMYPRLKLLHKLLANDGAIFISIDDNEHANLKLICDEIFGESNLVGNLIWQRTFASKNDAKFYSSEHEYVLNYAKAINNFRLNDLPRTSKQNDRYKNPDNDERGPWTSTDLLRMEHRENSVYTITTPKGKKFTPKPGTSWRHPEKEMLELIANNEVSFGSNGTAKPRRKRFLKDVKDGIVAQTIWKHEEVGHTQEAKQSLKRILDESQNFFATPKSVGLVERIIKISSDKNDIILDSFAGSGTTAHAVLNLNKEDSGNRKFILVEMEDYANTITAERVKRVINGYGEDKKAVEGTGGDFTYYELGEPLFLDNGFLNEDIALDKILEYVWYSEAKASFLKPKEDYLLGAKNDTAYYFYYQKDSITTLDESFLRSIKTKASQYIIYADNCLLNQSIMDKYNIVFKKIPRDITRF
ncbi:site-specific DNA-methyltransferase [uncultured Winogradskyella sp.]|uniref:site-specific DNA-methyltransferase n=1 Tax=uncultured Winogradskyella sp. TaxID=395353 RepID=UPI0030D7F5EA|tara:strand:- start:225840 stop:227423 length:1584 start_codon:yes stop_codon:yes gene_type:complete